MGFCSNAPIGSLISTLLVATGCALFATGAILGLKASEDFLKDYQQAGQDSNTKRVDDVKDIVSWSCYGLCAVMAILCATLLVRGFFATTKDDVWGGGNVMSHTDKGRCVNILLIFLTFIVFIAWTGLLCVSTVPVITSVYMLKTTEEFPASSFVDLRYFLIVPFDYIDERSQILGAQLSDAHDDLKKEVVMFFIIAWGGALICVWGLAGYLLTLAGTWGIGVESLKQEKYLYRRNMEQRELEEYSRANADKYHM